MPSERRHQAIDTSDEAFGLQIEALRAMSAADRVELTAALCRATLQLMDAGIAARYPLASDRERFLRRAVLLLGRELATRVYPDTAGLID
jgi:hypothetical protein